MFVIPVPAYIYLPFLIVLSVIWAIWVVVDVLDRGLSKYSVKRVLRYVGSGVVIAFLWALFVG